MEADSKRRQVSLEQLNALVEFLKGNPQLAKGLARGRRGKLHTLKLWNSCAKQLNDYKDGAHKDGKGWSKYWCDWKYRVRRRALELKAAQETNRPLPDGVTSLSSVEENILSVIGENALEGVVIKCDPLGGEEGTIQEPNKEDQQNNATPLHNHSASESKHTRVKKRRHSSRDESDSNDGDSRGNHIAPPERKPKVSSVKSDDSDDDHATQFLKIERLKLDTANNIRDSLKIIASKITALTDVMTSINDVLINRI